MLLKVSYNDHMVKSNSANYIIPLFTDTAHLSMNYFILSKVYTDEGDMK